MVDLNGGKEVSDQDVDDLMTLNDKSKTNAIGKEEIIEAPSP